MGQPSSPLHKSTKALNRQTHGCFRLCSLLRGVLPITQPLLSTGATEIKVTLPKSTTLIGPHNTDPDGISCSQIREEVSEGPDKNSRERISTCGFIIKGNSGPAARCLYGARMLHKYTVHDPGICSPHDTKSNFLTAEWDLEWPGTVWNSKEKGRRG